MAIGERIKYIPNCFTAYNTYCSISKSQGGLRYSMGRRLSGQSGYVSMCRKCEKCEKLCPPTQKIFQS